MFSTLRIWPKFTLGIMVEVGLVESPIKAMKGVPTAAAMCRALESIVTSTSTLEIVLINSSTVVFAVRLMILLIRASAMYRVCWMLSSASPISTRLYPFHSATGAIERIVPDGSGGNLYFRLPDRDR